MVHLSRRHLLASAAGAAIAAAVPGAAGAAAVEPGPARVLRSHQGRLRATLTATTAPARVAGVELTGLTTYNGLLPGPLLRVRPGDRLQLHLRNRATTPTNLHFHGFHVSPKGDQDNVFLSIDPGRSHHYDVRIPRDHPGGLYWYHPHLHGYVGEQVYGGLAGLLLVEGGAAARPEIAALRHRLLAIRSIGIDGINTAGGGGASGSPMLIGYDSAGPDNEIHVVNGRLRPSVSMAPGETQFWQVANVGADPYYLLEVPGGRLQVVEEDGVEVWRTWQPDAVLLPPGKRFGLLVTAPDDIGRTTLRSRGYRQGPFGEWPAVDLLDVVVAGRRVEGVELPTVLAAPPSWLSAPVARRRVLTLGESPTTASTPSFFFNGVPFEELTMKDVITVQRGTVEEWVIRNGTSALVGQTTEAHPYHQHVNGFCIVERGRWDPRTGEVLSRRPERPRAESDTTSIEPNEYITIRTHYARFVGRTVYHCHILFHEDNGMMGVFDIVDADGNGPGPDQELPTHQGHGMG